MEFQLEDGISDMEAMRLIETESGAGADKWKEDEGENVLRLNPEEEEEDPFTTRLFSFQQEGGTFSPVIATRSVLSGLGPGEVIVCRWPPPLRNTYYRNLMPDMAITKCQTCNKVTFDHDNESMTLLSASHCPNEPVIGFPY